MERQAAEGRGSTVEEGAPLTCERIRERRGASLSKFKFTISSGRRLSPPLVFISFHRPLFTIAFFPEIRDIPRWRIVIYFIPVYSLGL